MPFTPMTFGTPDTGRPKVPAKKWRAGKTDVAYAFEDGTPCTSEAKAFAIARNLIAEGHAVTIWHFENGRWCTWEKLTADGLPA